MKNQITHTFPLPHVHMGTPLGNGYLGLSVWGEKNDLNLTVGCSALWDHRGGMAWTAKQNYPDICRALAARDAAAIREIFASDTLNMPGVPERPSLIPLGRLRLSLGNDAVLKSVSLSLTSGVVTVKYQLGKKTETVKIVLGRKDREVFAVRFSDQTVRAEIVPGWELAPELRQLSFPQPEIIDRVDGGGFVQSMPADESYGLMSARRGDVLICRFFRGQTLSAAQAQIADNAHLCWAALLTQNQNYWRKFWHKVPQLSTGNAAMDDYYRYGIYKFQSMTDPGGVPAGLQGPWLEDDRLPPWSGDYHFNINVQMCYWPACRAGLFDNLQPLFALIKSWRPTLRRNAGLFIDAKDGYMLPHAVDDRCICMGAFWSGTIDHACAAWMAQMMFEYVQYSGDLAFLREFGFDFMRGTFAVYHKQLIKIDGQYCLPVGLSPEYRGDRLDAWGANASFQLAAIHRLVLDLTAAAQLLELPPDPVWDDVAKRLPPFSLVEPVPGKPEIALWEGVKLEESHRHHSHLGAVAPFQTVDPDDPALAEIIQNSKLTWQVMGRGRWAGWSMPWAVMLHNRFHEPEAGELTFAVWQQLYVNQGGGTLHDPWFDGIALGLCGSHEIMQMDAGMGMVAAIQDMFVFEQAGYLHLLQGIPRWRSNISCHGLFCPGGFRFSFDGKVITLKATRAQKLHLIAPDRGRLWLLDNGRTVAPGEKLSVNLAANQTFIMTMQ